VSRSWTTISCRAFALCTLLLAGLPTPCGAAADKPPPPGLPIAEFWSVDLKVEAAESPVSDDARVFIALKSAHLTARSATDGHELWRITKEVSAPMAAAEGFVFVSAGDAIEALRGSDGGSAWIVPRVKTVAPLVARDGWLIAITESEILAIRAKDGTVVWRHATEGVKLPPEIDGDRLVTGADDGRVLAMTLATGAIEWDEYVPGGVTALAAKAGRVYAGAGDQRLYCLDGRSGKRAWSFPVRANPTGRIAVDDKRVYVAALNNVIFGLDRSNGNQQWTTSVRRRPSAGVLLAGHVIFVPVVAPQLSMLYDENGRPSGTIALPGEITRGMVPDIRETAAGVKVFAITGGLSNEWRLTFLAPAGESTIVPPDKLTELPGVPFLTDPALQPIGRVLGGLALTDPPLAPLSTISWPVVLQDPLLVPLTSFPGLQMRPLSPVLPTRRGG
jgi:outer membrane protein assembly factor BamB